MAMLRLACGIEHGQRALVLTARACDEVQLAFAQAVESRVADEARYRDWARPHRGHLVPHRASLVTVTFLSPTFKMALPCHFALRRRTRAVVVGTRPPSREATDAQK